MQVVLLSYPQVTPANLALYRSAAARRGIELLEVEPHRLAVAIGASGSTVLVDGVDLCPDAVVHRTVANAFPVVSLALTAWGSCGVATLNDPVAASLARDKAATAACLSAAGVPFVETVVVPAGGSVPAGAFDGEVVAKPACGARGEGVVFHADAAAVAVGGDGHLVVQPAVGPPGVDLRAYVVDGETVALMRRRAQPGERRANATLGAGCEALPVDHPAAVVAAAAVAAVGLDHGGVDLVDVPAHPVFEVEAWAGFAAVAAATGVDVAGAVLDLAARRAEGSR
jgi:ribosomal protein S6--L-glutamate ligase